MKARDIEGFVYWHKKSPQTSLTDNPKYLEGLRKYLFIDHSKETPVCDVAILLGRHVHSELMELLRVARQKFKEISPENIIVSGGAQRAGFSESEVMKGFLEAAGITVPILKEGKASNTRENIQNSLALIAAEEIKANIIAACGEAFHARRVLMTINRWDQTAHPEKKHLFYALQTPGISATDFHTNPTGIQKVFGEVQRIQEYLDKGDIAPLNV